MVGPGRPIRARCDGGDRLIEADEPLAGLQLRCGGELPGPIAIPALLALVRKSRRHAVRLARTIRALDDGNEVAAWAAVQPVDGGSVIELSQWRASPLASSGTSSGASSGASSGVSSGGGDASDPQGAQNLLRHLAEGYARLDGEQRVLASEMRVADLAELQEAFTAGRGHPWTDFVVVEGSGHHQPLHWRLVDGATISVPGSERKWRAHLLPQTGAGTAGFELCLVPEGIAEVPDPAPVEAEPADDYGSLLGRELAPALRQPINRIIANAETIRTRLAGPLPDQYSAYAADIANAGRHLLNLVEDLADLEAVEAPDFAPAPDRIDLAEVGRQAGGILSVRAADRRITLVLPSTATHVPAIGEFRRVVQVLLNLISNAIRYSPEDTTVTVDCGSDEAGAWIAVTDQGHGLDTEQARKAFAKFERLGRKGDGGSGLGLYISRRLARAMGGELTVESAPGEGARFVLRIPRDAG
jgi:anti-sigma regulatory factor (Ser/Thr protein kinase)